MEKRALMSILMLIAFVAAAQGEPPSAKMIPIQWSEGPRLPVPAAGHAAAVLSHRIVVLGGTNWVDETKHWYDEIWVLENGRWRSEGKLPIGIASCATAFVNNSLLVAGGLTERGPAKTTFAFSAEKLAAKPLKDLPSPRAMAGGGFADGSFYLIGGVGDPSDFKTATTNVMRLKIGEERTDWTERASLPHALAMAATVPAGGKIFLFGGMGPQGSVVADSAEALSYDPLKDHWTALSPLPGARRGAAAVALDDRRIMIIGGCRNGDSGPVMLDGVLLYEIGADRYRVCTPLPFAALGEQAVLLDGRVYVIGGEDLPRHRTDRVVIGTLPAED